MKNKIILIVLVAGGFILMQSLILKKRADLNPPEEVQKILESSCYDCHTSAGRNDDAKKALNFEEWDGYRLTKKISVLDKMTEVIKEDKMPPGKYLEFKPDRKLDTTQKDLILKWAEETSNALMEGN
ncbi:MAG: heme-binding domain-containing protein [Bacteroidales bacterium]